MDNKYSQGRSSAQSVCVDDHLYRLSNGNEIRICSMCDDPEYEYGYDYFNGETKKLIDGGVFNLDAGSEEEVLREAIAWCDLNPDELTWELINEEADYGELEELGYTGF